MRPNPVTVSSEINSRPYLSQMTRVAASQDEEAIMSNTATGAQAALPPGRNKTAPFYVLAKPSGPACNLRCSYCFYLEKKELFPRTQSPRMSDETLERFIRDYIDSQHADEITFGWQGGEPTLRGLDFFRKVVELQQRYAGGRVITNALQTNGMLIDDEWAGFLAANRFLVGISIDGPAELHDAQRVDAASRPTLDRVLQGLDKLKAHGVDFNTLTVVSRTNARHPLKVYRFLKEIGSRHIQFIPLVERITRTAGAPSLAGPPVPGRHTVAEPAKWSVSPMAYGGFLARVFEEWVKSDVGTVFVQAFENALSAWLGAVPSLCVHAPTCGRQLALEHDGTLYACDHYVYPEYRLGNLNEQSLAELVDSAAQRNFGVAKRDGLPNHCRRCVFLRACNGGCPKHRFRHAPNGEPGLNYLCAGYRHFFQSADPCLRTMAHLLRQGRPAADIMGLPAR